MTTTSAPRTSPGTGAGLAGRARAARDPLVVGGVVLAGTLLVALVDPHHPGSYGVCPSLWLFGVYCPLCGGLRATHDLAHGDVAGAWAMNPLWTVAAPTLVLLWARWLVRRLRAAPPAPPAPPGAPPGPPAPSAPPSSGRRATLLAWGTLVVLVAFGVARNLPPLAPWLAPHG